MRRTVRAIVTGRVQGVGFRAWVEAEAQSRGVDGWVRNRRDGSVEAVLCGDDETVADMVGALWMGPGPARVTDVAEHPFRESVALGFRVLPTA